MKVGKILKHIDFMTNVEILSYDGMNEESHFKGAVLDVPWRFAEMLLDTDEAGEAIGVGDDGTLYIYVREE